MTETQLEKYGTATDVYSDPFGIIKRDNRNHRQKARHILNATTADDGDRVLEVGCGSGLHTQLYADKYDLHAVDISQTLVDKTRQRAPKATVMRGDGHDLIYQDDAFQAVLGTAILHHLHDQEQALREWARVTKAGGTITLMEPNYLFPKDFVTAHLVEAEQHKTEMAVWRLRRRLSQLTRDSDTKISGYSITPRIYTPPWPDQLTSLYDRVDSLCERVPGVRWMSQMLEIHIQC